MLSLPMRRLHSRASWSRLGAELAFLLGVGALMTVIGPYGTSALPWATRAAYWTLCIVGGGLVGTAIDEAMGRRLTRVSRRIVVTSALMTPAVAALVIAVSGLLLSPAARPPLAPAFVGQVFVICALVTTLRVLIWRPPRMVVETHTVIQPPAPEAEIAFRRRLSARRRGARLIAIQAEDHYLRVHTDAGEELLTLRFADALQELGLAHGHQTHRSWWVAADAIEGVRWRKGVGQAHLAGGLVAPVSRTRAPALKEAGWF